MNKFILSMFAMICLLLSGLEAAPLPLDFTLENTETEMTSVDIMSVDVTTQMVTINKVDTDVYAPDEVVAVYPSTPTINAYYMDIDENITRSNTNIYHLTSSGVRNDLADNSDSNSYPIYLRTDHDPSIEVGVPMITLYTPRTNLLIEKIGVAAP